MREGGCRAAQRQRPRPPRSGLLIALVGCVGVCLSRRPRRAAPRVTGGDSRPSAQPPTCIKTVTYFYGYYFVLLKRRRDDKKNGLALAKS